MKFSFLFFSLICIKCFAQDEMQYYESDIIKYPLTDKITISEINDPWQSIILPLEAPVPGSDSYRGELLKFKSAINEKFPKQIGSKIKKNGVGVVSKPTLLRNFQGNDFAGGIPNDNNIAISNSGIIISAVNSSIDIYDIEQEGYIQRTLLGNFFSGLGVVGARYDPKLVYDPIENRFILVCLIGSVDSTSYIAVAFSQTEDPTEDWNIYKLPGNPKNNMKWSDFPAIGISKEELFITINLLDNRMTNEPDEWKYLFYESLIWQIKKSKGYTGDTLQTKFYDNIKFSEGNIRNLIPVQGGAAPTGPNMYFLSNRNFALENDTFFILEITGELDKPETTLKIDLLKADIPYGLAPPARQADSFYFDTNDSRVLGCFIENDKIQFVQNTRDPETNFPAIYHGIISNITTSPNILTHIINDPDTLLDFGYPSIAYTGNTEFDDQAIIMFNHSGPANDSTGYAGVSAVFFNMDGYHFDNRSYSEILTVKQGETYVDLINGGYERWGDYTAVQRKYNEPGKTWLTGYYGQLVGNIRRNSTWIAELQSPVSDLPLPIPDFSSKIYPNPNSEKLFVYFNIPNEGNAIISLFDTEGKKITQLINQYLHPGEHEFSFLTELLHTGVYFIQIELNNEILKTEKVILHN